MREILPIETVLGVAGAWKPGPRAREDFAHSYHVIPLGSARSCRCGGSTTMVRCCSAAGTRGIRVRFSSVTGSSCRAAHGWASGISWASNCSWHHARPLPHQSRRSLPGGGADANRIVSPRQNLPALLFGEGSGCGRPPGRRPLFHLSGRAYVDPAGAQNPLVRSRHYCSGRTLYGPPHSGRPSNRRRPPACERFVGGAARPGDTRGPPQAGIRRSRQECSVGPAAFCRNARAFRRSHDPPDPSPWLSQPGPDSLPPDQRVDHEPILGPHAGVMTG